MYPLKNSTVKIGRIWVLHVEVYHPVETLMTRKMDSAALAIAREKTPNA